MSDLLSGKNGIYVGIVVLLIFLLCITFKLVSVFSWTPSGVKNELEDVFDEVSGISPISLRKAEFLIRWGEYRNSDDCSDAVMESQFHPGNGFDGDVYIVSYPDSIEFPVFSTFHRQFRVEQTMSHQN